MEQTVAERPLSKEQQTDQGQIFNHGSIGRDTHIQQQSSDSWYPRRWTGWSSPRGDNLRQDRPLCRDFLRGKCARGTSCKYRHCESDSQEGYKSRVCHDFLAGRCSRVPCKFLHPESVNSDDGCRSDGKENIDAVECSGKSQFNGEMMNYDSRTRSFYREPRNRSSCRNFLNGMCHSGESCPYLHSEYPTNDRPRNYCSNHLQQGVASTSHEHEEGIESNEISPRFISRVHRSKSPCRHFLRGTCYRGAACPYYHPDSHLKPKNVRFESTSDNPGFSKGNVSITTRTSEELSGGNAGNEGSRSSCRNFLRGRCYRGRHCPYLHSDTYISPRDVYSVQQYQGVSGTSYDPCLGKLSGDVNCRASEECKVANEHNDRSTGSFPVGYRSKSPCRNFLRGSCYRGEHCPFLHLDTYARTRDDYCTQLHQGVAETSKNPGFGEGAEVFTVRASQEHEEAKEDEDMRNRYVPRRHRSRSPCRRFLSGRCYRGALCPYSHSVRCERSMYPVDDTASCEQNRARSMEESMQLVSDRDKVDIPPRSWSSDRQRSRPHGELGGDKPRPEVCLKYCKGRCTLGESCRYLHSFHEYAKSASDWTRQPHVEPTAASRDCSGEHQRDHSMMCQELDTSFVEKTRGQCEDNTERPNNVATNDEAVVMHQQKCEINGEVTERTCSISVAGENTNLQYRSLKRQRSRSSSPFTPRDEFECRKMRQDEYQPYFHWQRSRSRSPFNQGDDFGHRRTRRDESYFGSGRGYNVARFRYPYSSSYRYGGPKYYMNNEPQSKFARISVDLSSHEGNEDPNVGGTQGPDEFNSHEMQLDEAESVKDDVQSSHADQAGDGLVGDCNKLDIPKGEDDTTSFLVNAESTKVGENHGSSMDTVVRVCHSNEDNNAEVKADLSKKGSDKTDEKKQELKTYIRKMERKSSATFCMQPLNEDVSDLSTHSDDKEGVLMISHLVQEPGQGNGELNKESQNNVEPARATAEDGTSVSVHFESDSMQESQLSSKAAISSSKRKLLVLDVNGLLADIVALGEVPRGYKPDTMVAMKAVFKRPFCDDFLEFCFERFDVGVWSSRTKKNVDRVVDFLMFNTKKRLLFCWDQAHCTETGYKTIENRDKPLVLKELKKLWEKHETDLPWDKGFYNETNTILLDDSPYKALRNPPCTAIFPFAYKFRDVRDTSLGPGGDLRVYLEKLAAADNVQKFIQQSPFGQRPITKSNLSWGFYSKIAGVHVNLQEGNSSSMPATKVVGDHASEQERNADKSLASKSSDHQKGNANNISASKSVGAHTENDTNANKGPARKSLEAHAEQKEGDVDKGSNESGDADNDHATETFETRQEGSGNETLVTKDSGVHIDQPDANAVSQLEGNVDNTIDARVLSHSDQQDGNSDRNHATISVGVDPNQPKENVSNTSDSKS